MDKSEELGQQIIRIIRMTLITEREVEELKMTLADNIRFDISDAFRAIDLNSKGYVIAQDIFRFMSKNGFSVNMKMCDFWIFVTSNGQDKVTYQQFLEFIIPKYDREAAIGMITRKLYSEAGQYKLSFYLEEFVSKLIYKDVEFAKSIEVEKMKLAQMVEWKFNVVFSYVAGDSVKALNKSHLDNLLAKFEIKPLEQRDYQMFLARFNRNDDQLIQRDEFNDAMFPSGYLMAEKMERRDEFMDYVINQNQQLDQYLGRDQQQQDDDYIFRPEEHKIETQQHEDLVKDEDKRIYLNEDPQLAVSRFEPFYKPAQPLPYYEEAINGSGLKQKPKNKRYVGLSASKNEDLLEQFEKRPQQQMGSSIFQLSQTYQKKSQLENYSKLPTNAQLIMKQYQ